MELAIAMNSGRASALATSLTSKAIVSETTVYDWEKRAADALVASSRAWHLAAKVMEYGTDEGFDVLGFSFDATNSNALNNK